MENREGVERVRGEYGGTENRDLVIVKVKRAYQKLQRNKSKQRKRRGLRI